MRKEELIKQLQECDPLLANAVSHMVTYVQDRYPSTFPSKEQTEAVNNYLRSVHADGDGSISERNCEHRRIASQNITIAAIRVLDSQQLDRLQNVLDNNESCACSCLISSSFLMAYPSVPVDSMSSKTVFCISCASIGRSLTKSPLPL